MANYRAELVRDGVVSERTEVQAGSDVEAAKTFGPVKGAGGHRLYPGDAYRQRSDELV